MANSALIADLLRQYSENPRRVFARLANELRKSGDYDRAIEICRGQIPQQPGYISGHIVLGQSLYDCGRLEEARQTFETALNLDPENLIALRHLGDIARQHGETEVAIGWYRRLLEVDPQNDEVVAQLDAMGGEKTAASPAEGGAVGEAFAPNIDLDNLSVPAVESAPSGSEIEIEEYRVDAMAKAVPKAEPLDIETSEAFGPSAGAEKAFPDLEQSLEVTGIGQPDAPPPGDAQAMFGGSVLDEVKPPHGDEPRDAVDAYYPMLDVQASSPSPSAFVTETMAELYLQQGYVHEALDIYRQLAAQNPGDETLRERVRQLEQGSRSSVGMAAISDDVMQAAHKRATTKPKKTIRQFFARLAMRRVVEREPEEPAGDDGGGHSDEGFAAPSAPPAPLAPSSSATPAPSQGRRTAPELEEPAWLRSDAQPEPEPPQASHHQEDVPWLAGYEPDPVEHRPSQELPRPHTGGDMIAIPPSELFPTRSIAADDENAAAKLASVFEPDFAARLTPVRPLPAQHPPHETPTAGGGNAGMPRKAEDELSLDQVFGRTPASGSPEARSGFTFDEFFDEKKDTNREGTQDASSEIELFNTWLDQLKK
jgi:tetratricopeptide (TPR) repeat protein